MSDNEDIYFEKPKLERQVATSFDLSPPKLNIPEPPKGVKHFWNNFESPVKESNRFKVNLVTESQISNWYNSLNFYEKKKWLQYFISNLSENDFDFQVNNNELKRESSESSFEKLKSKFKSNELD